MGDKVSEAYQNGRERQMMEIRRESRKRFGSPCRWRHSLVSTVAVVKAELLLEAVRSKMSPR